MTLRVTSTPAKIGYGVGAIIVMLLAGLVVSFAGSLVAAQLLMLALGVGLLLFAARVFRGPSEDVAARRAWWRLTERPTAGYVLGAVLAGQTTAYVVMPVEAPVVHVVAVVVGAALTVAYLHSSARLAKSAAEHPAS